MSLRPPHPIDAEARAMVFAQTWLRLPAAAVAAIALWLLPATRGWSLPLLALVWGLVGLVTSSGWRPPERLDTATALRFGALDPFFVGLGLRLAAGEGADASVLALVGAVLLAGHLAFLAHALDGSSLLFGWLGAALALASGPRPARPEPTQLLLAFGALTLGTLLLEAIRRARVKRRRRRAPWAFALAEAEEGGVSLFLTLRGAVDPERGRRVGAEHGGESTSTDGALTLRFHGPIALVGLAAATAALELVRREPAAGVGVAFVPARANELAGADGAALLDEPVATVVGPACRLRPSADERARRLLGWSRDPDPTGP